MFPSPMNIGNLVFMQVELPVGKFYSMHQTLIDFADFADFAELPT